MNGCAPSHIHRSLYVSTVSTISTVNTVRPPSFVLSSDVISYPLCGCTRFQGTGVMIIRYVKVMVKVQARSNFVN